MGFDLIYGALDLKGGERELRRAVELSPNYVEAHHWYATALLSLSRYPEGTEEMERARELELSSRSILADKGLLRACCCSKKGSATRRLRCWNRSPPNPPSVRRTDLAYIHLVSNDGANYLLEARKSAEYS